MKCLLRILALGAASLALSACSVAHVSNVEFNASESPEVRGPSTYVKPNENISRVSVSLIAADEDQVKMPVHSTVLDEKLSHNLKDGKAAVSNSTLKPYEGNNAFIDIGGYSAAVSADFIMKWDPIIFQIGIAAYDGAFYYASIGANHKYYEYGLFLGEFHQFTKVSYYGYWCSVDGCTEEDKEDTFDESELRMLSDVFLGIYAGAHFWRFSLNYTLSTYTPSLDVPSLDYKMPAVVSNYLSLGFRITDELSIRGGAVASLVRTWSKPHLGLKFSIDYSVGESDGNAPKPANKAESAADTEAE